MDFEDIKADEIITLSFVSFFVVVLASALICLFAKVYVCCHQEDRGVNSEKSWTCNSNTIARTLIDNTIAIIISNSCIIVSLYFYEFIIEIISCAQEINIVPNEWWNIITSFLLLFFICISNGICNILFKKILGKADERTELRLSSSATVLGLLIITCIFMDGWSYSSTFILTYLTMILGRFIFFDSSCKQFANNICMLKPYFLPATIALISTLIIEIVDYTYINAERENVPIVLFVSSAAILFAYHALSEMEIFRCPLE